MKIRNGFVSNSSSSSFIVNANDYTCKSIALDLIQQLYEQDAFHEDSFEIIKKNLEKLENENTSIFIEMADDMEISKCGDIIHIEASNHYDFEHIQYEIDEDYGDYYDNQEKIKWYLPLHDNKILGTTVREPHKIYKTKAWLYCCDICGTRYLQLDSGDIFCPKCNTDPDGNKLQVLFREEKLKRIMDE